MKSEIYACAYVEHSAARNNDVRAEGKKTVSFYSSSRRLLFTLEPPTRIMMIVKDGWDQLMVCVAVQLLKRVVVTFIITHVYVNN